MNMFFSYVEQYRTMLHSNLTT